MDSQAGTIKGLHGRKGTHKERKRNPGTGSDMSLTYKMTSGAVGRLVFSQTNKVQQKQPIRSPHSQKTPMCESCKFVVKPETPNK